MKNVPINMDEYRNRLRSYFLTIVPNTNASELNELIEEFSYHKFPKKEFIYAAGGTSDTLYFVLKGLIRVYYVKEDKEITNLLVTEGNIIVGAYNIITGEKNYSNYVAFEDTYVLKIKYSVLESYYMKYHSLEHFGRKLVEKYYTSFMKKTYEVLFLSAEERYQIFVKDHSELLKRVPLKHIAAYLGIKQETLSRLRAKY